MTSDDALCAEIAGLCGWTYRTDLLGYPYDNPDTYWQHHATGETMGHSDLPRYDVDPGAALGLLGYVCSQSGVGGAEIGKRTYAPAQIEQWFCLVQKSDCPHYDIDYWGSADAGTRERAIARACRDALVAIREQETRTP